MSVRTSGLHPKGPKVLRVWGARTRSSPAVVLVTLCGALVACRGSTPESVPDLRGERVEVVAVWQDAEASAFEHVLRRFEVETGAEVTYTSGAGEDITAVLDRRLESGDPPDLAILPQPGLLERYAREGAILPIDEIVGARVGSDWAPVWRRLGSVDGQLYGLWFKVANKSLVWYSIGVFEQVGVVPPDDLDGLGSVARILADHGVPAFSLTGAASDAWTLTDWFENLYLRLAGPERYDDLAEHRIPWTDETVDDTLEVMEALLDPSLATRVAGPQTTFPESVSGVFSLEPDAAMVVEGDFVPGVVAGSTPVEVGVDVDAFDFPGRTRGARYVVGAGDAVVLMQTRPAAEALLRFLSSTEAAEAWVELGGFISPNEALDLSLYPDPTSRRIARSLLEAGDQFRFDLSDVQPVELGGTTGAGLWSELSAFVEGRQDRATTMARLETAASVAWAGN